MTLERPREVSAVEAVYSEHGPRLYRSLLAYAGDRHIAEDAMAEAFAQALRRGSEPRDPARLDDGFERLAWRRAGAREMTLAARGVPAVSCSQGSSDQRRPSAPAPLAVPVHHL